jgi:hypothetical protein
VIDPRSHPHHPIDGHYASPGFPVELSGSGKLHAALFSAAWQEVRVHSGRDDNSFLTLIFPIINPAPSHPAWVRQCTAELFHGIR